jgi:hypothetical protein
LNNLTVILSTAYLVPVQYYSKLISYKNVIIEQYEHFSKQSYRNRCNILTANGLLPLSIPVLHYNGNKIFTKDIKIDYTTRWKVMHKRAIESAYRSSPFYLYYADEFFEVFDKEYSFLVDFNNSLQTLILDLLDTDSNLNYTKSYISEIVYEIDFRESIHPKPRLNKPDNQFVPISYHQVFQTKFGFVPNLSIIDLLFNAGPTALDIIQKSTKF